MNYTDNYNKLAHLFIEVIQCLEGMSLESDSRYLFYAEPLAIKLFRHLASMRQLCDGLSIKHSSFTFSHVDHSSVKLLTRAAFETYLTLYYVFIDPKSNSEKRYRYKTWELAGLMDRQKLHATSDEGIELQRSEAISITMLKNEISGASEFKSLSGKEKKIILKGSWRGTKSWTDLAVIADFNKIYFKNVYGYMCSYAHSSFLSALQIRQATNIEIQRDLANSMLGVGVVLMSHFLFSYSSLFNEAKKILDSNPEIKEIAEIWRLGNEDMAHLYSS